ncbi:MAG: TolC family protein, partial [Candidatus Sulfotelmatobacter sp.]
MLTVTAVGQQKTALPTTPPVRLSLDDALQRARRNSVVYQGAVTEAGLAHEDKKQVLAGLLPSVNYNNAALYTEGTGVGNQVKFIANDAIHEYVSQGNVHEVLDLSGVAEVRRAIASEAAAKARAEIAARGLLVTVIQIYYAVAAAGKKLEAAEKAAEEGERFLKMTTDLEQGGEVAHSDVIKAELQVNDRGRQLHEAKLTLLNARLDFAVLVFPDFNDNFELTEDLHASV